MPSLAYPDVVKTIEAIRLENFFRLAEDLRVRDSLPTDKAVAGALGISAGYLSQLRAGVRSVIDSDAARKIERATKKPTGWMDTDFDLWPFPDKSLLEEVERLERDQRVELQGALRQALANMTGARVASGKSTDSPPDASQRTAAA